jgi:uncharacterized protein (UPF0261 family)
LGRILAEKASAAAGPVTIALPLRGVSAIDKEGNPFYDADADRELFDAIRANVRPNVKLVELDLHINDPEFAERLVAEYLALTGEKRLHANP